MNILVTGGAGYVGSHTVRWLLRGGHQVVVLDDLSTGHMVALPKNVFFFRGSITDIGLVQTICKQHAIEACVHFAAKSLVGESVKNPRKYWTDNVVGTQILVGALLDAGVTRLVFSSTAAVYGEPETPYIVEQHPKRPLNPYGRTKLAIEEMLEDYTVHGLRSIALRYFNAAGAEPEDGLGERHDPETHLIPLAIGATLGTRPPLTIYGEDYPTPDGTCIRDYVHVTDLADAHARALDTLSGLVQHKAYNLGSGKGYSVREVLDEIQQVSGLTVPHSYGARRIGDPAILVADATKAETELGWRPERNLSEIIQQAWQHHRA